MKQPYIPIPCAFHDRLLHFATLRQVVRIAYLPEGQADAAVTQGIIVDVFTQGGAECLHCTTVCASVSTNSSR
jgi:hypothetical protein